MQGFARVTAGLLASVSALALLPTPKALAQAPPQFIIESRTGGQNFGWFSTTPATWTASSGKSAAPGTTAGIGSRFFTWPGGATNGEQPTIVLFPLGLVDHGSYLVEVTHIAAGSLVTNLVVDISIVGGTLSTNRTHVFNNYAGTNSWTNSFYFTNDTGVTAPVITFAYLTNGVGGGYLGTNQSAGRWYADAFRFTYASAPCLLTPQIANVDGPLAAGQTFVNVPGVVNGATNVTVYVTDGLTWAKIGERTSGVTAGMNQVATTPLVKGTMIVATQWKNGNESCQPSAGRLVGGGANPSVRLVYNIREDTAAAGPIGANGGTGGDTFFLGSSGRIGGFGSAPSGGVVLNPSANWQTVTFTRGLDPMFPVDPVFVWTTTGNPELNGDFGIFDGLGFAINDLTDTGPFQVYIGKVINGGTVLQDFSAATNDQPRYLFGLPSDAGFTADKLLANPDISVVVTTNSGPSGKSLFVNWQFNSTVDATWLQLATLGAGTPNPLVDLRQPIAIELLLLPVGTPAGTAPIDVSTITNGAVWTTGDTTMSVSAVGSGLSYQWYQGYPATGFSVPGAISSSYTLSGFSSAMSGVYSVTITDGVRTNVRSVVLYAVDPIPAITNQPAHVIVNQGSPFSLTVGADGHVPAGYPLSYQWRTNGVEDPTQTSATFSVASASLANVGSYDVYVWNTYGYATSMVATVDVVAPGVVPGTGTGLRGDYWTTHYSTNAFGGAPTLTRVDPVIDFNFGTGSPAASLSADYFTARWLGQVQALGTDTYTFSTISDDGVRLWVNNQLLVNNWTLHAPTTNSGTIALTGTDKYDIQLEFFENAGGAVAQLYWSNAAGSVGWEPVPQSQLYPAASLPTPTVSFTVNQGTNLVLNWGSGTYTLVWSTDVAGPYNNKILGAVSPYTIVIGSEPQRYFKVQVQ